MPQLGDKTGEGLSAGLLFKELLCSCPQGLGLRLPQR